LAKSKRDQKSAELARQILENYQPETLTRFFDFMSCQHSLGITLYAVSLVFNPINDHISVKSVEHNFKSSNYCIYSRIIAKYNLYKLFWCKHDD